MLRLLGVAAVAAALMSCAPKAPETDTVNIVSWGSQLQTDLMDQYVGPQAQRVKVNLRQDTWDGDYAALTTRIDRGINTWDIVHVEAIYVLTPRKEELFHAVPGRDLGQILTTLRTDRTLSPALEGGLAVPLLEYGYVVAGRASKLGGRDVSQLTWPDFWDVRSIPGRRGMRDFPVGNIEAALASKGHDPVGYLYAETDQARRQAKVDEALERISELTPHIVWWKTGEQLQQGLETGDMPLAAAWSGRVLSAFKTVCPEQASVAACDVRVSPRTAFISTDWWIIPKNAANKAPADRLLRAMISAEAAKGAAAFAGRQGYAVPLVGSTVTDPVANHFLRVGSSANEQKAARLNEKFWGEHYTWINQRWLDFRLRNQ